ncbi:hypothetical protein [Umezawaea beigongshangensis]|uniref:hypothetical protein n=1 Tax=Umezawaea beigongshangensis TaxID=2780383 RepID=UPI0018F121C4|nr:hypothetical protein [Umezawaea beigongshangensis]
MFVTYSPDGDVEERTWEFEAAAITAADAEPVEASFGRTWDEFLVELVRGGIRARRHLLWLLMRREHPALRYEDVPNFATGQLLVELDRDELQAMRDGLPASTAPEALARLDAEIAAAPEGSGAGKALSNRRERRTASRSRPSSASPSKTKRR